MLLRTASRLLREMTEPGYRRDSNAALSDLSARLLTSSQYMDQIGPQAPR